MLIKKQFNLQVKKIKVRGDEIAFLFLSLVFLLFLIFSSFRIFAVGKLFDDFIFILLFGWDKYLVYLILFVFTIPVLFNRYLKFKISFLIFILLVLLAISWMIQNIYLIKNNSNIWTNYSNLRISYLKDQTAKWWDASIINNYHGFFSKPVSFYNWRSANSFFPSFLVGGIFSTVLISLFSYGFFVTNFILNIILFIPLISLLIFKNPFIIFSLIKFIFKKSNFDKVIFVSKKSYLKRRIKKKNSKNMALLENKTGLEDLKLLNNIKEKKSKFADFKLLSDSVNKKNGISSNEKDNSFSPVKKLEIERKDYGADIEDEFLTSFKENNALTPFGVANSFENKTDDISNNFVQKKEFSNQGNIQYETQEQKLNAINGINTDQKMNSINDVNNFDNNFIQSQKKSLQNDVNVYEDNLNLNYSLNEINSKEYLNNYDYKQKENQNYALLNQSKINQLFQQFGIKGRVENFYIGTTVTKYEISIISGMRVNKITSLENELKLSLANNNIRIEAPIPGKSMIGIEVANLNIVPVTIQEQIEHLSQQKSEKLLITIGKTTLGNYLFHSLKKMPHLLIAGSTGAGKSVYINDLLVSLLLQYSHKEVKLLLIDPKWVELAIYNDIPHLLSPVINDVSKAVKALKLIIAKMMDRYKLLAANNCRNIDSYNDKVSEKEKMPYYVVVIDELADLMMQNSKEIEETIMRITQMGRAAGIHIVVATQRPSTNIITGVIKNNIPSRIAFQVSSWIDSRTIIDTAGAEKLLGKGDMLFVFPGSNGPVRVQAPWISEEDVIDLINKIKKNHEVIYDDDFIFNG